MRLIDAEKVTDICDNSFWPETVKKRVAALPTIDAVPVVRCKDCKYYHDGTFVNVPITTSFPLCFRLKNADKEPVGYAFPEDHFCAYGEQRDKTVNNQ